MKKQLSDLATVPGQNEMPGQNQTQAELPSPSQVNTMPGQSKIQALEKELVELSKEISNLEFEIKTNKRPAIEVAYELTSKDVRVKQIRVELENLRFEEHQQKFLEALRSLCDTFPVKIRKLYFELEEIEVDGVRSTKPVLRINEMISLFGKRKTATKTNTNSAGKVKMWKNLKTGEVAPAKEVYQKNFQGQVDGTAEAGAWGRVLEALHNKSIGLDWVEVE